MFKKLLCLLLALMMLTAVFTGCSNSNSQKESQVNTQETQEQSTSEETKKPEPVTITMSHAQGEWIWPVFDDLGKQYNEKSGNTIEFNYVPAEGYQQWLQAQLVAGTEPDIIWGADATMREDMFNNGQIIGFNTYFDEASPFTGKPWKESFLDGILSDCVDKSTGNTILGMPLALVTVNTYYNKDLFKELGLPDRAPETYGELLQICKTIKDKKPDVVPFAVMNGMSWNLGWMVGGFMEDLWVNSGVVEKLDIINKNDRMDTNEIVLGVKTGVIDPADPRFLDYFSYMKELSKYFNKGFNSMMWEYEKLFNDGQAAIEFNGSWYPNQHLLQKFTVNYGTGSLPIVDTSVSAYSRNEKGLKYAINVGGADLLVTAKAKKEGRSDAAVDFMRFLSDPASGAKYFVEKTMLLPVVKDVQVPEVMKPIVDGIGTLKSKTFMGDIFNLTPEQGQEYQNMLKVFLEDNTTPEEFVKKFKEITLQAADKYIDEKPEMKVKDYIDKVSK